MTTALITGASGQDGGRLAERPLAKGEVVHGIRRRASACNTGRGEHLYQDRHARDLRFLLHYGDLRDTTHLIRYFHEAKVTGDGPVTVWGSGTPMRAVLYGDDRADAIVHRLKHDAGERHLNAGTDGTMAELAKTVRRVVGVAGEIVWDTGKPDGPLREVRDVSRMNALGWRAQTDRETGLADTYDGYRRNIDAARAV